MPDILTSFVRINDGLLERSGIAVDRMLNDDGELPSDLRKVLQERPDVLGPEDDTVHVLRPKRDAADLGVERVDGLAVPGSQTSGPDSVRAATQEAAAFRDLLREDELDRIAIQAQPRDQPGIVGLPLVEDAPGHHLTGDVPAGRLADPDEWIMAA